MEASLVKFKNFNTSLFGSTAKKYSMPGGFGTFSQIPLFSFHLPLKQSFEMFNFKLPGIGTFFNKSSYSEDTYYPELTGKKFDSSKLFNSNLNKFKAVSYTSNNFNLILPEIPKVAKVQKAPKVIPNTRTSLAEIAKIYDKEKGAKLASKTLAGLNNAQKGYCARAVKTGILNAGLGAYESGHANDVPNILSDNKNFKEVHVSGSDIRKLPAGCVICYPPGDCGYNAKVGHVTTSDGNGKGIHFQVDNLKISDNVRVFVPVSA